MEQRKRNGIRAEETEPCSREPDRKGVPEGNQEHNRCNGTVKRNEALLKKIRAGQHDLLSALIENNRGMILRLARYYLPIAERNRGADIEDLQQAAALGIILAASIWDESRGGFLTIAVPYMRNEMRRAAGVRISKKTPENMGLVVSLSAPIDGEDGQSLIDTVADETALDPLEAACNSDLRRIVRREVERLPEDQREAITAFYLNNAPAHSIDKNAKERGLRRLRNSVRLRENVIACHRAALYHRGGLSSFRRTHTSPVESAVLTRERMEKILNELQQIAAVNS